MIIRTTWGGQEFEVDLGATTEISVRLEFDGPQPNAFGIDRASAQPFSAGDWVADTRLGASVNCFVVTLCPHGNGTHTECVGHIVDERVRVADVLSDLLSPAWLASVSPVRRGDTDDEYDATSAPDDLVVTRDALESSLTNCPKFVEALVIRTAPNSVEKASALFSGHDPVYLTSDAMRLIDELGVRHLLVDFPSVDREDDGGALPNHRIYWGVAPGSKSCGPSPSPRTITEMVFAHDDLEDGLWCACFEIPDFALDAAPSRIRLAPTVHTQKQ